MPLDKVELSRFDPLSAKEPVEHQRRVWYGSRMLEGVRGHRRPVSPPIVTEDPIAMARVRLELPSDFIYQTDIALRISDINYGNHLGNDAVLTLVHEARVRFLQAYAWSELDIGGYGLIIADAVIVYKAQGYYGDVVRIAVTPGDFNKYGCDLYYLLTHAGSGKEIARAKTGIVFYDYTAGKMVPAPAVFRECFSGQRRPGADPGESAGSA